MGGPSEPVNDGSCARLRPSASVRGGRQDREAWISTDHRTPRSLLARDSRMVQRPAGERGKPGAENCARIHEIRIADDAFGERRLRLADIRAEQPLGEAGRHRSGRPLRGLPGRVVVKAALRLAAEVPGGDQFREPPGGRRIRRQHPAHRHADVEPDGVGEFDRSHRHAERERRLVDGFG